MSRKIILVSCVSEKQKIPSAARDLYVSDWFRKASAYAKKCRDAWYILSAKHGLVHPDEILEPYNETLNRMSASKRKEWAHRVLGKFLALLQPDDTVVSLAGKRYREYLIKSIEKMDCRVEVPMLRLRIGEQKSWLKKQLKKAAGD